MDKQDELYYGLQHFSKYMHDASFDAKDNKPVSDACKVVAHIADAVLHAAVQMAEDAKK